jgi:hypothetical protein
MPSKVTDFLAKMSQDPKLRRRFKKDPRGVMAENGLNAKDRQVVLSGDPAKIKKHLGADAPPGCMIVVFTK